MNWWREVPIPDVIQRYAGIELKQRGRELEGLCPFHADKSPSLAVNTDKGVWLCRAGCGGGSSADFLMKLNNLSFREAVAMIETDFGTGRNWTPVKRQKPPEILLDEQIEEVFTWCFKTRLALLTELKRRGDDVPARMVLDLGKLEIISSELIGNAEQRENGLAFYGRWFDVERKVKVG